MTYYIAILLLTAGAMSGTAAVVEGSWRPKLRVWPLVVASLVVWGVGVWLGR